MKILCVNSIISEFGGAELSALNLAQGLADRQHEVHFLGARLEGHGPELSLYGDVHLHYRAFARPYQIGTKGSLSQKVLWHLLDLMGPSNEKTFGEILGYISPDIVILHNITGIGLNIWRTLSRKDIPTIQVIHDLGIVCLNKGRFRAGQQCDDLCLACRIQMRLRFFWLGEGTRFAFVSPSRAVLREIETYAPIGRWRREVIPNPNVYITRRRTAVSDESPRLLYVGRLDPSKGVEYMLRAAERARGIMKFELDVLGTGSLNQALQRKYAGSKWIKFHGQVSQLTIAEFMSRATILLIPSLWLENFPGVAVHALFAGLPILASNIGGIPEIVEDGESGKLLPPGDEDAWLSEIVSALADQQRIRRWSVACLKSAQRFEPKVNIDAYERLVFELADVDLNSE